MLRHKRDTGRGDGQLQMFRVPLEGACLVGGHWRSKGAAHWGMRRSAGTAEFLKQVCRAGVASNGARSLGLTQAHYRGPSGPRQPAGPHAEVPCETAKREMIRYFPEARVHLGGAHIR
jgi:hypothetical protein